MNIVAQHPFELTPLPKLHKALIPTKTIKVACELSVTESLVIITGCLVLTYSDRSIDEVLDLIDPDYFCSVEAHCILISIAKSRHPADAITSAHLFLQTLSDTTFCDAFHTKDKQQLDSVLVEFLQSLSTIVAQLDVANLLFIATRLIASCSNRLQSIYVPEPRLIHQAAYNHSNELSTHPIPFRLLAARTIVTALSLIVSKEIALTQY